MVEPRASATDQSLVETAPDLLLADLHLPAAGPSVSGKASFLHEAFLRFCAGPARQARRVFLLGDIFETWIGDDIGIADHAGAIAALRALSDSGVEVCYQTGNRDFLLGHGFERATGAQRLPDEAVVTLAGVPTLLAHGDQFCTDDTGYQRWRRFSRNRLAQWLFGHLPVAWRRGIAGDLRRGSRHAKQAKPVAIMDVNAVAIEQALRRHGVRQLIHGHTHRPATHVMTLDGCDAKRVVLADWRKDRIEWLRADAAGLSRETLVLQRS